MATAEANDVEVERDEQPFIRRVRLDLIRLDGGTQLRVAPNLGTVDDYAEAFKAGVAFPPADVYFDGTDYWPADGHQRIASARKAGLKTLPCNVRDGTVRDAILYAVGANESHGDRRTNADKRNAVETMLRDEEWGQWKNRKIAKLCRVSHTFVNMVKNELSGNVSILPPAVAPSDDPSSPDFDEPPNVQASDAPLGQPAHADDPPDVAEARRKGLIPATAKVDVREPQWVECETPGIDPADYVPPPEPTAEEWLATLPAREKLSEHVRKQFDREALAWRAVDGFRAAFRDQVAPYLRQLDRDQKGYRGPWRSEVGWYLQLNDPSRWEACRECDGSGRIPLIGPCAACHGDGYRFGVPMAPKRTRRRGETGPGRGETSDPLTVPANLQ